MFSPVIDTVCFADELQPMVYALLLLLKHKVAI